VTECIAALREVIECALPPCQSHLPPQPELRDETIRHIMGVPLRPVKGEAPLRRTRIRRPSGWLRISQRLCLSTGPGPNQVTGLGRNIPTSNKVGADRSIASYPIGL
jgi:hypothetical protein